MDFSVSPELQDLLGRVRQFVEEELFPLETEFLSKSFRDLEPVLNEKRAKARQQGFWLPQIPKEYGGLGLSLLEHGLFSAELGRSPLGNYACNCQAPDSGNMEILLLFGNDEQKATWLKPLVEGHIRSCFAMTEPEFAGSNPVRMATTAVKDGDDYVITGHKWFASSADGAAFAVVMAVTDPDGPTYQRASQIIVPTDTPGFELVCNIPVMGERGDAWASHAELRFNDVRVPQSNLLGPEGAGFAIAQERLGPGRIHHCMRWIGICERSFDLMCSYAAEREVAEGRPLGVNQFVQGWIADSRAEIDAARLLVLHAAWKIEKEGAKEARDQISTIKFYVANVMQRVVDRAIQTHGGLGMTDYTPLAYFFRHERAGRIYDGPDEVHKLVVAKRLLKRYGIQVRSGGV
jgi:acyl-CoA dehydrogenase